MSWWMIALAWAGSPAEHQAVAELEWSRAEPVQLLAQLPGADAALREQLVRALGRLRQADTGDDLLAFRDDPSPQVRLAAASALGWVPGTAPQLRSWLAEVPPAAHSRGAATLDDQLRARLVAGLGRQGTARDLDTLRRALGEPWPTGASAAHALGRLGIRDMPGAEEAVADLVHRLRSADPRLVQASAFALARIGMSGAPQPLVQRVREVVHSGATGEARAWALKACWSELDPEAKQDLLLAAATSTSRLLRVAAFDRVSPGDVDDVVLASFLGTDDPWVRAAVIGALGRLGSDDASLVELAEGDDPHLAAEAVQALGWADPEVALDPDVPVPVRAAHALGLDDTSVLTGLLEAEEPPLRSAAGTRLLDLEPDDAGVLEALHTSSDPTLRQLAVELLAVRGRSSADTMARWAREESHPDVLASLAEGLVALHQADRRALRKVDVRPLLTALGEVPLSRARAAAEALAGAAGAEAPQRRPVVWHDPFAEGADEAPVVGDWPALQPVEQVLGAVVHTDHGRFTVQLDPATAPLAVAAFVTLAERGVYDGLLLHRVVPGFVVQGGDPRGDGWGDPGWALPDEVSALPFDEGALGMARGGPDTGGSQWFVTTSDQPHLVGAYTRFGEVSQGLHHVRRMPRGTRIERVVIERSAEP
jgi:cyclophilin family peptidyl-prolyl cis-trans isomerase/HEAT repeat protein